MPFFTQGKTNWKFLLIIIILAVIVGGWALWYAKKEISSVQLISPKTQKEISKQKVLELENQILEPKFGSKITEFSIIKKISIPSLESCPGIENYTQNHVWFSEGFLEPFIKGFSDYAIEGFVGTNGEFVCLYANRRGAGSGTPPLIPIDTFYDQVVTADWKSYRNEEHGYEFKIPNNYHVSDISKYPSTVSFGQTPEHNFFITVDKEPIVLGFRGTWGPILQSETEQKITSSEKIKINGITFTKNYWGSGPTTISVYTTYNNKVYSLLFGVGKTETAKQEEETFNQMLSTFKFMATKCLEEGQIIKEKELAPSTKCCNNLSLINVPNGFDDRCRYILGSDYVCTNCGNGVCDKNETLCNCWVDCQKMNEPLLIKVSFPILESFNMEDNSFGVSWYIVGRSTISPVELEGQKIRIITSNSTKIYDIAINLEGKKMNEFTFAGFKSQIENWSTPKSDLYVLGTFLDKHTIKADEIYWEIQ